VGLVEFLQLLFPLFVRRTRVGAVMVMSAKLVQMAVVSAKVVHMAMVSAKVAHVMAKVSMGVVSMG